jgi:hypothetical protein
MTCHDRTTTIAIHRLKHTKQFSIKAWMLMDRESILTEGAEQCFDRKNIDFLVLGEALHSLSFLSQSTSSA